MVAMRLRQVFHLSTVVVASTVLAGTVGLTYASRASARPDTQGHSCFFLRQWKGHWTTAPDARSMYISVGHSVYRLDLAEAYPLLKSPWAVLLYRDSSSTICTPSDFRLVVSDRIGVKERIIVRKMTRLSSHEVSNLPKSLRP